MRHVADPHVITDEEFLKLARATSALMKEWVGEREAACDPAGLVREMFECLGIAPTPHQEALLLQVALEDPESIEGIPS